MDRSENHACNGIARQNGKKCDSSLRDVFIERFSYSSGFIVEWPCYPVFNLSKVLILLDQRIKRSDYPSEVRPKRESDFINATVIAENTYPRNRMLQCDLIRTAK
jgi:hypothetical protein